MTKILARHKADLPNDVLERLNAVSFPYDTEERIDLYATRAKVTVYLREGGKNLTELQTLLGKWGYLISLPNCMVCNAEELNFAVEIFPYHKFNCGFIICKHCVKQMNEALTRERSTKP